MENKLKNRENSKLYKKKNTILIHKCMSCGHKWDHKSRQPQCPECGREEYISNKNGFKPILIKTTRVNTKKGKIVCHLANNPQGDTVPNEVING